MESQENNGLKGLVQNLMDNSFIGVITTQPNVIAGSLEKLFGKGTQSRIVSQVDNKFTIAVTANGDTAEFTFSIHEPTEKYASRHISAVTIK